MAALRSLALVRSRAPWRLAASPATLLRRGVNTGTPVETSLSAAHFRSPYTREFKDIGVKDFGWLKTHNVFSFSPVYRAPEHRGYFDLRVVNFDIVQPRTGFETHPHKEMEIVTYVLGGKLTHKDSTGKEGVIGEEDVQLMSAGMGIQHSEKNETDGVVRFVQIWVLPDAANLKPTYQQQRVPLSLRRGGLKLLCSPTGRDGSLIITSDTDISSAILRKGERVSLQPKPDRAYWIQVLRGGVLLNGDKRLLAGDGHGMYHERQLEIVSLGKDAEAVAATRNLWGTNFASRGGDAEAELLLFDLEYFTSTLGGATSSLFR